MYAGVRAGKDARRYCAWVDEAGEERWFKGTRGKAIGSRYTVRVTRRDGGGVTLHGTPEYAGGEADPDTRRALWAADTLARTALETARAERDAARRNALDEAIGPLLDLARPLRTGAERDALAAYVIRRLHSGRAAGPAAPRHKDR